MAPAVGTEVWLERRKWPDSPHYGVLGRVLGEDSHGVWVGAAPGSPIVDPDGTERRGQHVVVWCVPRDGWFMVHVLRGHPDLAVYIDICTPAVWTDRGARLIDLDFDVVVWNDDRGGHVELVDEDEFEEHRVRLGYPDELVMSSRRAAHDVLARTQAGDAPFTASAASRWLDLVEGLRGDTEKCPPAPDRETSRNDAPSGRPRA